MTRNEIRAAHAVAEELLRAIEAARAEGDTAKAAKYAKAFDNLMDLVERETMKRRNRDALVERADMGRIVDALLAGRSVDGAEAELQDEYGLDRNQIPLAMLRTTGVTPGPTDGPATARPVIPYIFPMSAHTFLGIGTPTVAAGEAVYNVLTTAPTVHAPAKGAEAAHSTGTFTSEKLDPSRLQASVFFTREDRARVPGMASALRRNLADALSSGLDAKIIASLQEAAADGGLADVTAATAISTYAAYKSAVVDSVDGRHATMASSVRLLVGAATYRHASGVYRGAATDEDAAQMLTRISGGFRVSSHMAAAASNVQEGIAARATGATHAVAPVWEGVTLIPDEITKASSGEIVLTAVMLYAFAVLRQDGFNRRSFKLA